MHDRDPAGRGDAPTAPFDVEAADRLLAEIGARIAELSDRIKLEKANGHDTSKAQALLATFEDAQRQARAHRALIVEAIARGEG